MIYIVSSMLNSSESDTFYLCLIYPAGRFGAQRRRLQPHARVQHRPRSPKPLSSRLNSSESDTILFMFDLSLRQRLQPRARVQHRPS